MPIYSWFVVKKKKKKKKKENEKEKRDLYLHTLANKLEAGLAPLGAVTDFRFLAGETWNQEKITKETSTKEGRNLHALQAVSTTARRRSLLRVPRSRFTLSSSLPLPLLLRVASQRVRMHFLRLATGMRRNSAGAASDEINFI